MSEKGPKKTTDKLLNRKKRENPREKVNVKQKAKKSFSIPYKLRKKPNSTNKLPTLESHQQEKIANEMNVLSSTLKNTDLEEGDLKIDLSEQLQPSDVDLEEDSHWETNDSVEKLRSSDIDRADHGDWQTNDSLKQLRSSECSDLVCHGGGPISSTPFSPSKEKGVHFTEDLAFPDVSYIKGNDEENTTLTDVNLHSKTITPMQIVQLPDIPDDVLKEYSEQNFDSSLEGSSSKGFNISEISNQCVEPNFDDEYVEQNFDAEYEASIIKNPSNVKPIKRKQISKVRNFSENIDYYSSRDSFENNQNIETNTRKKKGKVYKGDRIKSNCRQLKKKSPKDSFEYINNSYTENIKNVQNIKTEELQSDEISNNQPKTMLYETGEKMNKHLRVGNKNKKDAINISDELRYSNQGIRKRKDINNFNNEYNVQNVSNECAEQNFDNECAEKNFDVEYVEQNFDAEYEASIIKKPSNDKPIKRKQNSKVRNCSENIDYYSSRDSFENNQNIETNTRKKKGKVYKGDKIKSNRRQLKKKSPKDSFEYINNSYTKNIKNVQNIPTEELQSNEMGNNQPKTILYETGEKMNKHIRVGNKNKKDTINISDESRYSNQGIRKRKDIKNFNHEFKNFNDKYNVQNVSNECAEQNFDNECAEKNFGNEYLEQNFDEEEDEAVIIKRSSDVNLRKRKENNKLKIFFSSSSDETDNNFGDNQNAQTDTPKKKGKLYRGVGIKSNRRQDTFRRRKIADDSFIFINNSDTENSLEKVQKMQNEELIVDELDNNRSKNAVYQTGRKKNKRLGVGNKVHQDAVSILNDSQYSSQKTRTRKNIKNSIEDILNYDSEDNLEEAQKVQIQSPLKTKKLYRNSRIKPFSSRLRSKKVTESLRVTQQGAVSIPKGSHNSNLERKKRENNCEKSGEDIFNFNNGKNLGDQNIQTDFLGKKGKFRRGAGIKRCSHEAPSKAATVQKTKNEAKKPSWPICCLTDMKKTTFNILQPVILEGVPIDSISLMLMKENQKECHHW